MDNFNKLINKFKKLQKIEKEICKFDYSKLRGINVLITKTYRDWLYKNTVPPEANYELTRPSGQIEEVYYDKEDGITVSVIYPNGTSGYYDISNIEICNKSLFLKDCEKGK